MTARRSLSAKERLRLFTLHSGICHLCEGRIDGAREAWEVEHEIPLAMGGADDDKNRKPAHVKCHGPKTAIDLGNIAKAKRREARHAGAKAPSKRPMPGARDSQWKRTFGHGWVKRDEV